jgi:CRP-like cAMP-binding protein
MTENPSPLAVSAATLREFVTSEERALQEALARAELARDQIRIARRALAVLEDKPAAKPKQAKTTKNQRWRPRPETVERAYQAFLAVGEPTSPTRAGREAGIAAGTVISAIPVLREQGRLRLVGSRKVQGGGRLYAVIPEEEAAPIEHPAAWPSGELERVA